MLGDCLASHLQMATKLVKGLAVLLVELVQQGAARRMGESFEDVIHRNEYATKWLHVYPGKSPERCAIPQCRSVFQIQRPRPEIDDRVMRLQNLSAKKSPDRTRTARVVFRQQPFQVGHTDRFPEDVDMAD